MRSRALAPARSSPPLEGLRSTSPAAPVFLRGRDADGRPRESRAYEALGYRSLGDYPRERLGVGARVLRERARVGGALEDLQRLRGTVLPGELSWSVARRVVALVTPETEGACLEKVCGRKSARRWVTLRRLENDVDAHAPTPAAIAFRAPAPVAELFLARVARAGSIERRLAHAIATWVQAGERFDDYAD